MLWLIRLIKVREDWKEDLLIHTFLSFHNAFEVKQIFIFNFQFSKFLLNF